MSECMLLEGKTGEEAVKVCLNCPYPECRAEAHRPPRKDRPPRERNGTSEATTCRQCSGRRPDCPGLRWYAPSDIQFCRHQVEWLLSNLADIRGGVWPAEEGSYIDPKVRRPSLSSHALFEVPVQIAAELERRCEDCGHDGLMVLLTYAHDYTPEAVAKYFRLDEEAVSYRMQMVLRHISRRKYYTRTYRRWNVAREAQGR